MSILDDEWWADEDDMEASEPRSWLDFVLDGLAIASAIGVVAFLFHLMGVL